MKSIYFLLITMLISITSFTQISEDTTHHQFDDDLLDHLVGKWNVTGFVYGAPAKLTFQGEWVLNHQFIRVYEKSDGNIPGANFPFEAYLFIGYDNYTKSYIPHIMSMYGGTCGQNSVKAYETGNEFKLVIIEPCVIGVERFIWEPATRSWHIESRELHDGKEGEVYLDLKAISIEPSSN
jgi:hypothetical protein